MRIDVARPLALTMLLALAGCGREEILHGLDEPQANQVLVALDEAGVAGAKRRDEGSESTWRVDVDAADVARAHRLLVERELPRTRPAGFGEVFGKGSLVPTPAEERALYLHALSGELARSVEAIDGVTEARVHLALPPQDLLRTDPGPPPRAAVLVKARPGARGRLEALVPGIQAVVAGSVAGLDASAVAVVVSEALPPAPRPASPPRGRAFLLALAGAVGLFGLGLAALPWVERRAGSLRWPWRAR